MDESDKLKAVVLLSGGLDSSTALYLAQRQGFECHCLIFEYSQRHRREIKSAVKVAKKAKCRFKIIKIKLPWSSSSLTDNRKDIPENPQIKKRYSTPLKTFQLPSTYVPGRNTIFISYALSYAESINAKTIFIGANAVDFSGYPDCRPKYYRAWKKLLKALGAGVEIRVPLIGQTKEQIIKLGTKLKVPYKYTWSCYKGGRWPCGVCDSCKFRAKGFREAGRKDPAAL
ncbi:MAG: 7-cyano-7-deazaguanine synthase QueC [Endomicrobiales bacterium]|nr:7-cyano-7-deazaguanine synthase QueC [Endomicrobiales bacterium]